MEFSVRIKWEECDVTTVPLFGVFQGVLVVYVEAVVVRPFFIRQLASALRFSPRRRRSRRGCVAVAGDIFESRVLLTTPAITSLGADGPTVTGVIHISDTPMLVSVTLDVAVFPVESQTILCTSIGNGDWSFEWTYTGEIPLVGLDVDCIPHATYSEGTISGTSANTLITPNITPSLPSMSSCVYSNGYVTGNLFGGDTALTLTMQVRELGTENWIDIGTVSGNAESFSVAFDNSAVFEETTFEVRLVVMYEGTLYASSLVEIEVPPFGM
ncbi:MAG: hypothetical protein KDA96_08210 [Planctomycetaceae bacterium]|nr:hypothetical protein [Planctomycetaceae bacterium]